MKNSIKIRQALQDAKTDLRIEIYRISQEFNKKEVAMEFDTPIYFASGFDEQDNPQEIQYIEFNEKGELVAEIYHQGNLIDSIALNDIDSDMLLLILEGLEKTLENI